MFFKKMKISILNYKEYGLLNKSSFKSALAYIFVLCLVLGLLISSKLAYEYRGFLNFIEAELNNGFPNFNFKGGVLKVNQEDIIVLKNKENIDLIIDTIGKLDKEMLDNYNKVVLIQRDRIFIKLNGKIDETRLDTFKKIKLNKNQFKKYIIKSKLGFLIIILGFPFIFFIENMFLSFLIFLLGVLVVSFLRVSISFRNIFKLSMYASSTPIILNSVLMLINYRNLKYNYISIIIGFLYLFFGIKFISINRYED